MAGSRREKIGSVFARMTGLLRAEAIKEEDRPIWYDVVKAFPPKEIPPQKQVQTILYPEDFIRVHFYKTFVESAPAVLTNEKIKTVPQRFVDRYLELQLKKAVPNERLFDETVRILKEEGVKLITHQEKEEAEKLRRESLPHQQQKDLKLDESYTKSTTEVIYEKSSQKREKPQVQKVNLDNLFTKEK